MPNETIAGLIPRIILQKPRVPSNYAVLITDRRSIFIREVTRKSGIGVVSGEAVGGLVSPADTSEEILGYEQSDPDLLATDPKNFVILHEWLERIVVKKNMIGSLYRFNIEYLTQDGKGKRVEASLVPPSEPSSKEQDKMTRKAAFHDYARKVQEVYRNALPAGASATIAEWRL